MTRHRIPNIIAIFFLVAGLAAGVLLVQQRQVFNLSASNDYTPRDVRISNVSDDSFTVSWYTDRNTIGAIYWGENTDTSTYLLDQDTSSKKIHYVVVEQLSPSTRYSFTISSRGKIYDNSGIPWSITTTPNIGGVNESSFISGKISSSLGTPASDVIVYVQMGGAYLASAQTSSKGIWVIPTSEIVDQSLKSRVNLSSQTLVNLYIQGGSLGVSTAQVYLKNANPVADIILGESYDFRNTNIQGDYALEEVDLILPNNSEDLPRFELD